MKTEYAINILKAVSEQMENALDWADWFYTQGERPFSKSARGWQGDRVDITAGLVKVKSLIAELEKEKA